MLRRRRVFSERPGSPDDLARTIRLLYDTSERLAHLAEIRWLRAHPAQGGLRVCDCRGDRLVHFMSNRGGGLAHGSDAVGMRQLALHLAILPLATGALQSKGVLPGRGPAQGKQLA